VYIPDNKGAGRAGGARCGSGIDVSIAKPAFIAGRGRETSRTDRPIGSDRRSKCGQSSGQQNKRFGVFRAPDPETGIHSVQQSQI
jgi:hypothetical protein